MRRLRRFCFLSKNLINYTLFINISKTVMEAVLFNKESSQNCSFKFCLQIKSPSPEPSAFVVKPSSKSLSAFFLSIFSPLYATVKEILLSFSLTEISIYFSFLSVLFRASTAFLIRFKRTF